jgi:hypothetical protein
MYETGLQTHAANELALFAVNDYPTYCLAKHARKHYCKSDWRWVADRALERYHTDIGITGHIADISETDMTSVAEYLQDYYSQDC